jgi:predicted dienelactone hydrolase
MLRLQRVLAMAASVALFVTAARAGPVGERHLIATNPTAALRDAAHSPTVRVTIWYPAAEGSAETSLDLGPPASPLFLVGQAAPDAAFADARRRPVLLFAHGYGGTARMMGWFTTAMARAGYIVVAVDHPGNNSRDKKTLAGAILSWDRAGDLRAALDAVKSDPTVGPHLDLRRLGAAGYATGGFTALVAAGARVDLNRFLAFCHAHPTDGLCAPQREFPLTLDEVQRGLASPELAAETAHAGADHTIPGVRAVLAIAPAIVQALPPEGLARMTIPVAILLGDADTLIPPDTNGLAAAKALPHVVLKVLPGVGHYDFVSTCTPAGMAADPGLCTAKVPQDESHTATIDFALAFFGQALGQP